MILTGLQITDKNPLIINFYIGTEPIKDNKPFYSKIKFISKHWVCCKSSYL